MRVTNTQKMEVLAMSIPSKVGGFNQDYYPAFNANEASSTAEAWVAGTDVPAKTMQLAPPEKVKRVAQSGLQRLKTGKAAQLDAPTETPTAAASSSDSAEVTALKA